MKITSWCVSCDEPIASNSLCGCGAGPFCEACRDDHGREHSPKIPSLIVSKGEPQRAVEDHSPGLLGGALPVRQFEEIKLHSVDVLGPNDPGDEMDGAA